MDEVADLLMKIGYTAIPYFIHGFGLYDNLDTQDFRDRNSPITGRINRDYYHCMFSANYFKWIARPIMKFDTYDPLIIKPQHLYKCSFFFEHACHFFNLIATNSDFWVLNTDTIKIHKITSAADILKNILTGDFNKYEDFFGFSYPNEKETIEAIWIKEYELPRIDCDTIQNNLWKIGERLRFDEDRKFYHRYITCMTKN